MTNLYNIDLTKIKGDNIDDFVDDEYYNKSVEAQQLRVDDFVEGAQMLCKRFANEKPKKEHHTPTFQNIQLLNLDQEFKIDLLDKLAGIVVNGTKVKLSIAENTPKQFSVTLGW